jgi:serine kinase of HPr protein (carbohydrate metabolism regulator)
MSLENQTIHASCVSIGGRAVLIAGESGSGKSDLSLRLVDRGATLVSDDYTLVVAIAGRLVASPPPTIAGRIEVRGVGLVDMRFEEGVTVCLLVDLDRPPERLPDGAETDVAGLDLPVIGLSAHEASAPIKVETALDLFGLPRA